MSGETQRQKDKKNRNRPRAGDIGYKSSIQKRSYKQVKEIPVNENQQSLLEIIDTLPYEEKRGKR